MTNFKVRMYNAQKIRVKTYDISTSLKNVSDDARRDSTGNKYVEVDEFIDNVFMGTHYFYDGIKKRWKIN